MRIEPHMGLKIWNLLEDPYDHEQQADNLAKLGAHDHSPGRGVLIPTEGIAEKAITEALLAEGAVTAKKIAGTVSILKEIKETAVGVEILAGELLVVTKAVTITLPAPTAGRVVGIFAKPAAEAEEVTVKQHGAEKIFGPHSNSPTAGTTTVTLTSNHFVVLEAEGTNWLTMAGRAKLETKYKEKGEYTQVEMETGVTFSKVRDTIVRFTCFEHKPFTVGGEPIGSPAAESVGAGIFMTVYVPAGQVLKGTSKILNINWLEVA